jgi:hypothetical protein
MATLEPPTSSDEHESRARITTVEERFERRLATVEANIIKWMFIFWVGQVGVITGILFAFFRR